MTPPCIKSCPGRSPTCHTSCEKYREYQQKTLKARAARQIETQAIGATCDGARRRTNYKPMI